jgi:hypothetical protein
MYEAAKDALGPLVTAEQLDRLCGASYKLEVVLGRLWGTVGPDALDCVLALTVDVPNEAHMLAALHLLRGGTHVTVNFDIGIELAHDLIQGRADLAAGVPRAYQDALESWRRLSPPGSSDLRTVSSHDEFAAWSADDRPAALLKVHGGLGRDQATLADVVVVDIEELAQLTADRATAIAGLSEAAELLITGYSGGDPDVYTPLLAVAAGTTATWACLELPAGSEVADDLDRRGVKLVRGVPGGLAVTALRRLLGTPAPPSWPSIPLAGPDFDERFTRWRERLRAVHPADLIAQSWAWLLADLGDLDTAVAMLAALPETAPGVRLRQAEMLYNRARGGDRDLAGRIFREVGAEASDAATRMHCLLRRGDLARGRAAGSRSVRDIAEAYFRAGQVLVITHNGHRQPEEGGDAYRLLQQTSLRLLEQLATIAPRWSWRSIAVCCRLAAGWGGHAARLVRNGNRLSLIRQHRALLRALDALLGGRPAPAGIRADMLALRATYRAADDRPGAGNCTVALAVLAQADGDRSRASALLDEATAEYAAGRPDGRPLPSGQAVVDVMKRLFVRAR